MDPKTQTIIFSVVTIVYAFVLLFIILRLGAVQNDVNSLKKAKASELAATVPLAPTLTPGGPEIAENAPTSLVMPSSITTTGSVMRNAIRAASSALPAAAVGGGVVGPVVEIPQVSSPVFLAATPAVPTGAAAKGLPLAPTVWESSSMNGSNPSVAVVVLAPASIPPGLV